MTSKFLVINLSLSGLSVVGEILSEKHFPRFTFSRKSVSDNHVMFPFMLFLFFAVIRFNTSKIYIHLK